MFGFEALQERMAALTCLLATFDKPIAELWCELIAGYQGGRDLRSELLSKAFLKRDAMRIPLKSLEREVRQGVTLNRYEQTR